MKTKTRNTIISSLFILALFYGLGKCAYDEAFAAGVEQCESIWAVNNKGFKKVVR